MGILTRIICAVLAAAVAGIPAASPSRGELNTNFYETPSTELSSVLDLPASFIEEKLTAEIEKRYPEEQKREPNLITSEFPDYIYDDCPEKGELVDVMYRIAGYKKMMRVYLPYGYDENTKYNVLVLLHGDSAYRGSWLDVYQYASGMRGQQVVDNMIYHGDCEPLIIACMDGWFNSGTPTASIMANELRNYVLPTVVSNFSTYAKADGSDLSEQRDHFALAGLSKGSIFTQTAGIQFDLDLFSWFGCFSYGAYRADNMFETLDEQLEEYPIHYLYFACGDNDRSSRVEKIFYARKSAEEAYEAFTTGLGDKIQEGVNAQFTWLEGGHDWKVWHMCLYNALQLFFTE